MFAQQLKSRRCNTHKSEPRGGCLEILGHLSSIWNCLEFINDDQEFSARMHPCECLRCELKSLLDVNGLFGDDDFLNRGFAREDLVEANLGSDLDLGGLVWNISQQTRPVTCIRTPCHGGINYLFNWLFKPIYPDSCEGCSFFREGKQSFAFQMFPEAV